VRSPVLELVGVGPTDRTERCRAGAGVPGTRAAPDPAPFPVRVAGVPSFGAFVFGAGCAPRVSGTVVLTRVGPPGLGVVAVVEALGRAPGVGRTGLRVPRVAGTPTGGGVAAGGGVRHQEAADR